MPTVFFEQLRLNSQTYLTDARPLALHLAGLDARPRLRVTPFNAKGYMAKWRVDGALLYLTDLSGDVLEQLFPNQRGRTPASWFSGLIHAWRGTTRHTGFPPRRFFDDEVILEVVDGCIRRQWNLNLRSVPDQISHELRRSLPQFLLKPDPDDGCVS